MRCGASQCKRPWSRNKLRAAMWQNRSVLTSAALWRSMGRKPGWGRTAKNIMQAIERQLVEAKKARADSKTVASLKRLLKVFVPARKTVRKAQRGH